MGRLVVALALWPALALSAPPTVLQPAVDERVPAGHDFATQELGDPWDFDRLEDTFTPNAQGIVDEQIVDGIYSFDTVEDPALGRSKAQIWLMHPGLMNDQRLVSETINPTTGRRLFTREKYPIDPSLYRFLTIRLRMSSATAQPLPFDQSLVVYYFEDETSIANATYGGTLGTRVPRDRWAVVQIDLATSVDAQYTDSWTALPQVEGLRIDPAGIGGVHVEIDWIRLTTEPANFLTVDWNGNGAPEYVVSAKRLGASDAIELLDGATGGSAEVPLDALPPGDYRIEVTGDGETGVSEGAISVNDAPRIELTTPNIKGDQSRGYGAVVTSNPWTSIDAGDLLEVLDFESWGFDNPSGTFYGRPVGSTSRILMNTTAPIDTAYYRMICYEAEVMGPRNIGTGSVSRILWGNRRSELTTSSPIITQEGLNEYCIGDMAEARIDPGSPANAENEWVGPIDYIRFDPHEFPRSEECIQNPTPEACRDVRLASLIVAPFHQANPDFTFRWNDSDVDDDALIEIYLDDDLVPGNTASSTEHLVATVTENSNLDRVNWTAQGVEAGTWNVYARIDDGFNATVDYAGGPLLVGAPPVATLEITDPDGIGDQIEAGSEYGLEGRGNQWDMDPSDIDLSRVSNVNNATVQNGIFSGTTANNRSQFILMSSDSGDPSIAPGAYRYLTMKIRISNVSGPHFVQAFFSDDPNFHPPTAGFTTGKPIGDGEWSVVTFDLWTEIDNGSPSTWNGFSSIESIRVDPTNAPGALFEIDWITLSAAPTPATEYTVRWDAMNLGNSTFNVDLVDAPGYRFRLASGLPSATRSMDFDLARFPLGSYFVEVTASPGPVALSPGAIEVVESMTVEGMIFESGFE